MSANLFGERFLGYREPAWHKLGTVFTERLTAVEAVERCNLNYQVVKLPIAGQVITPFGTSLIDVKERIMIAREPTDDDPEYRYFGIAGPDYGMVQNIDIASALDRLTDDWPVETVGALGKGETTFFTLDAGMVQIKGEDIHEYFLVTDTKDGATGMRIAYTPVRVVCQNTLISGLRQSTISVSMEHHSRIEEEFNFRVGLVEQMNKARATTAATFDQMASVALGPEDLEYILTAAYPAPKRPARAELVDAGLNDNDIATLGNLYDIASRAQIDFEQHVARVMSYRAGAAELFEKICQEHAEICNTPWAAYNAVVELADYRDGRGDQSISALFGQRSYEKRRAFQAALTVTNSKV